MIIKKQDDTLTLGELIKALESIVDFTDDARVSFDFCDIAPTDLDSYRGYYEQLAIGFDIGGDKLLENFIKELKEADGKTCTGYKGGEFTMDLDTPIWVDNYGRCTSTAIVGVEAIGDPCWWVILHTAKVD